MNPDLAATDPAIADIIAREEVRQNTTLQLIASENFTSPAVMAAQGTVLTNKYAEGYPGKRYYGGNQVIDQAEELARERVCALFGADHANVQPHSGANANAAVLHAGKRDGEVVELCVLRGGCGNRDPGLRRDPEGCKRT